MPKNNDTKQEIMPGSLNHEVNMDKEKNALFHKFEAKMMEMDNMMEKMKNENSTSEEQSFRLGDTFKVNTTFENSKTKQEQEFKKMDKNIFSVMIVSQATSLAWWYTLGVVIFQIVGISLIIEEKFANSGYSLILNAPIKVPAYVTLGQFIPLIIVLST